MNKYIKWITCLICLILFLVLSILVKTQNDIYIDSIAYNYISNFINDNFTNVVKFITFLGSASVVISITILSLIILKNKRIGILMALDLIVITIFQYLLKYIFGRIRPIDINIVEETGYSFPSGHSLTAMAFYGFIIYLIYKSTLKYKKIYMSFLGILIILIGFSRVYLGVHYITDVLGGFSFSLFYLIIFINVVKKYLCEN